MLTEKAIQDVRRHNANKSAIVAWGKDVHGIEVSHRVEFEGADIPEERGVILGLVMAGAVEYLGCQMIACGRDVNVDMHRFDEVAAEYFGPIYEER